MIAYDEEKSLKGLYVLFVFFQSIMLLIVYSFAYTALAALTAQKSAYTFMAYFPVVLVVVGFPVILYASRKRFKAGKRLSSVAWVMGWASVMIVGLYYHLSKLAGA